MTKTTRPAIEDALKAENEARIAYEADYGNREKQLAYEAARKRTNALLGRD